MELNKHATAGLEKVESEGQMFVDAIYGRRQPNTHYSIENNFF